MAYDLKSESGSGPPSEQRIIIQQLPPKQSTWGRRIFMLILGFSILANISMAVSFKEYFARGKLNERYHSREKFADSKVAVIRAHGLIADQVS